MMLDDKDRKENALMVWSYAKGGCRDCRVTSQIYRANVEENVGRESSVYGVNILTRLRMSLKRPVQKYQKINRRVENDK